MLNALLDRGIRPGVDKVSLLGMTGAFPLDTLRRGVAITGGFWVPLWTHASFAFGLILVFLDLGLMGRSGLGESDM